MSTKPRSRSGLSLTLSPSPLAHGILAALAALEGGGAEPSRTAMLEAYLREDIERRCPGALASAQRAALASKLEGADAEGISRAVALHVSRVLAGLAPLEGDDQDADRQAPPRRSEPPPEADQDQEAREDMPPSEPRDPFASPPGFSHRAPDHYVPGLGEQQILDALERRPAPAFPPPVRAPAPIPPRASLISAPHPDAIAELVRRAGARQMALPPPPGESSPGKPRAPRQSLDPLPGPSAFIELEGEAVHAAE